MNDKLQQLYNLYKKTGLIKTTDFQTFSSADENQRRKLYELGKQKGLFVTTNYETFNTAFTPVVKKKEVSVSPSAQKQEPISSATPKKEAPKPLATSALKGIEKSKTQPKEIKAVSAAAASAVKGVEQQPKDTKAEILFPAQKGKRNDIFFDKETGKTYRLDTSTGVPSWKSYSSSVVKGQGGSKQDYDIYNTEVTDPKKVNELNKKFNKSASVSSAEQVFTGYPGKEENEYRIKDGVWQRRQKGQDYWTSLYSQGSISALNKEFNKDVKYDAARSKYASVTEDIDEVKLQDLDNRLKYVNKYLIDKEEDEVVESLSKRFPEFKFETSGMLTDKISVLSPIKTLKEFSLDNFSSDADLSVANEMQTWMRANSGLSQASKAIQAEEESIKKEQELRESGSPFYSGPVIPRIKLGEGEGVSPEMKLQVEIEKKSPQKKIELLQAEKELKDARQKFATETSKAFIDIKDRQIAASRQGSSLDLNTVSAEIAQIPSNRAAIKRINEYANDVKDSQIAYKYRVDSFNKYTEDIYNKLAKGEITKEQYNNEYLPLINENKRVLQEEAEILQKKSIDISNVSNAIDQSVAQEYIIKEAQGSFGGGIAYNFVKGMTYIPRLFSETLDAKAQDQLVNIITGTGTTKEYMQSEDRSDITKALFSLSETIGVMASSGGNSLLQYAGFFGQTYFEMKDELDQMTESGEIDMTEDEKVLMSTAYGTIGSALEKFGVDFALTKTGIGRKLTQNILKSVFKDLPKNASKEFIEAAVYNETKKFLLQSGIRTVGAGLVEGGTEFTQALSQVGIKEIYDSAKDTDYFNNKSAWEILGDAAYEGYLGMIGGHVMGVVSNSVEIVNRDDRSAANKNDLETLFNSAKVDNIPQALLTNLKASILSGKVTKQEAEEIYNSYANIRSKIQSIPEEYSIENKSVALDLMLEKDRINKQISGKDANLVKPQLDRIAEIDNQLKKIGEDAVKESKQPVEEVTAEGGGIQYQGAQEGQPEVGKREGAVGETTQPETDLGNRPVEGRSAEEARIEAKNTREIINRPATLSEYAGKKFDSPLNGDVYVEGQRVIFEDRNSNRVYDLGNIDEVMDTQLPGLAVEQERVAITPEGKVSIEGNNWNIQSELPTQGIEYNPAGEVLAVSLKDDAGKTKMFKGQDAVDIAYQIELQKYQSPEQQQFINDLLEQDEEFQAATENIKPTEVAAVVEEKATTDTAQVKPTAVKEQQKQLEIDAKQSEFNSIRLEATKKAEELEAKGLTNEEIQNNPEFLSIRDRMDAVDAELAALKQSKTAPVEQTTTEQPEAEKVDQARVDAIGKLLEGTDEQIDEQVGKLRISKGNNKLAQSISNAAKAIAKILPDVKFVVHDTDESYRNATGEQNRKQSTAGEYNPKTRTIHINGTKANNRTAAHEVFHAVILEGVKNNAEAARLTKAMIDSVRKSLVNVDGAGEIISYLNDFASNYEENIQNEEKLAELFAILADSYSTLPVPTQNLIRRFLDRIAKMFGLKPLTDREVIDFMNVVSQKVARGEEIQAKEIPGISRSKIKELNSRFQADFSDAVSKLTFVFDKNGDRFKKLEKDGFITRDKSLSDFNGKYIFLHQPDAAFSGMIFKDGEVLVEGKGGVFYPIKFHEDGYFWASTDRTAKKMAEDLNKVMEQNGGTIYMALTSAPRNKLMSSTTMANAILDFFSSKALDKNFKITPDQLKLALRKAANDVKSVDNKKVGLDLKLPATATIDEIKSSIRIALDSDNSSFADRKNFALEITKLMASQINKNDIAINQFGKLFSEGIQNKYFKGITKTGKLSISAANMTQALSEMFTEPMLKEGVNRDKGGQVYSILELNGPVKPVKSDKHESYPMAIQSDSDSKVTLHILKDRQNWSETFEDFKTGDIVTKKRQKKIFPTSGVSVRGLKVNTSKVAPEEKTARKQLLAPNGKPSNLNEKQWNQVRTPEFKKWFGDWQNDPKNASKVVDENGEPLVVYHGSTGGFDEFSEDYLGGATDAELAKTGFFFTNNSNVAESYRFIHKNSNIDELRNILEDMSWNELVEMNESVMKTKHFKKGYEEEDGEYALDEFMSDMERDSDISNYLDSQKYIYNVSDFLKLKGIDFEPYVGGKLYEVFLNIRSPYNIDGDGNNLNTDAKIEYDTSKYDGIIIGNVLDTILMSDKDGGEYSNVFITKNPSAIKSATENVGTFSPEEKSIRKQIDNRNQNAKSINQIISAARQSGFTDAEITQYLLQQGYQTDEINTAMKFGKKGNITLDEIFDRSQKELEDKFNRRENIAKRMLKSFRNSMLDRQSGIKRSLMKMASERNRIRIGSISTPFKRMDKANAAKRAYDLLVTKAGAKGIADLRYKIAEKEIYGGLNKEMISFLDKLIYSRRIISINEKRMEQGEEAYRGMDGFSEANAIEEIQKIKNNIGDKKFNELNLRADKYFKVFDRNLDLLKESGRITEETYNNLKNIEYSPIKTIKYIIEDNYDRSEIDSMAAKLGMSSDDIMRLTDKNENGIITDSRFLLQMNLLTVESRAFENKMLQEFAKAIDEANAEEKVALSEYIEMDNPIIGNYKDGRPKRKFDENPIPDGYRKVYYYKNGVESYIVMTKESARQLLDLKNVKLATMLENAQKDAPFFGWLLKNLLLTPPRLLRFFATGGNPFFILGNVPMDWVNIVFFSDVYKEGSVLNKLRAVGAIESLWDFTGNFIKTSFTKNEFNKSYVEYVMHGGSMDHMSTEAMRNLRKLKPARVKALMALYKPLEIYGNIMSYMGESSEVAFRVSVYEKQKSNLIKKYQKDNNGKKPTGQDLEDIMYAAAREGREVIDFNQGGTWAKEVDAFLPYFNAGLQGVRRPLDYMEKNPIGFASSMVQLSLMASSIAYVSISAALSAFGDDDDEEKKKKIRTALKSINDVEKANYHIIFTGKVDEKGELQYIRIKKLPVASILTTYAEQLAYSKMLGSDYDPKSVYEAVDKSIPITLSDLKTRNPLISGLLTYYYNVDTFTGEKVFREPRDKKILPTAEGMNDDRIESIYKILAPKLGLSPARSKAFIEKIITTESTNPTINVFYAALNGIFDKNTTFGNELSMMTDELVKNSEKKFVRYTNKDIIRYKQEDEEEMSRMILDTDMYTKEQKVYNKIKKTYDDGSEMTNKDLLNLVKENFDPIDVERYFKKYHTYIRSMDLPKDVIDIVYERSPEVQALRIYNKYGSDIDKENRVELYKIAAMAGESISDKTWYFYNKKYKNR